MNNSILENICYLCKVPDKYCKCNSVNYSNVSQLNDRQGAQRVTAVIYSDGEIKKEILWQQ